MAIAVEGTIKGHTRDDHDWDQLFDGRQWMLEEGVDFEAIHTVRVCAYRIAAERGVKITTRKQKRPDGKMILYIQRL